MSFELANDEGVWSMEDQANAEFLALKYQNRKQLGDDWTEKRKLAEMSKTKEDGKPNPLYPRLAMEAEMARMAFDMAYVIQINENLKQQVEILSSLYERVGLLEGAYSYLRQSTDYVKQQHKDMMLKNIEERRQLLEKTKPAAATTQPKEP